MFDFDDESITLPDGSGKEMRIQLVVDGLLKGQILNVGIWSENND